MTFLRPLVRRVAVPLLVAALPSWAASCCCPYNLDEQMDHRDLDLPVAGGGAGESYRLVDTGGPRPCLLASTSGKRTLAWLGITFRELDKELAEEKGLRPYAGLLVSQVDGGSPADQAGVLPGDLLVRANGTNLVYAAAFNHMLDEMPPGHEVNLDLRRGGESGSNLGIRVVAEGKEQQRQETRRVPLETGPGNTPSYAGFIAAQIPAEWTTRIWGDDKTAIVVTQVQVGSPAYRGGLRPGDRILRAGGHEPTGVKQLSDWVRDWGESEEGVLFEVQGNRGDRPSLPVQTEKYGGDTRVCVPLLFGLNENVRAVRMWSLPLEILFSYRKEYEATTSRQPASSGRFSFLWGLFGVRWSPEDTHYRVLWFITFD